MPMFPLGTVLFPLQLLPLHVFEDRYRALTRTCLAGDRRFGVVLIERGHEVGGGDQRAATGTIAEIVASAELPDGRFAIEALGVERCRVTEWLPDDPHPWADVEILDDVSGDDDPDLRRRVERSLRRLLAMRAELGDPAPPATVELSDRPVALSFQASVLGGFTPLDAFALLDTDDARARLEMLDRLLAEQVEVAGARLDAGTD